MPPWAAPPYRETIMSKTRPSRTYRNGIGKPVVAKRWDDVAQAYRWGVVFPPCNNFGCWPVVPEAQMVRKAHDWCFGANDKLRRAALQGEPR